MQTFIQMKNAIKCISLFTVFAHDAIRDDKIESVHNTHRLFGGPMNGAYTGCVIQQQINSDFVPSYQNSLAVRIAKYECIDSMRAFLLSWYNLPERARHLVILTKRHRATCLLFKEKKRRSPGEALYGFWCHLKCARVIHKFMIAQNYLAFYYFHRVKMYLIWQ